MMASQTVLKCRECGEIRPAGYRADKHSAIDGCDGRLDPYCENCRKFLISDECAQCENNAREAERQRNLERKARIERVLSTPGLSIAYSLLRRWPWFRAFSDDFIERAGITARRKHELALAAGIAAVSLCAPTWMQVLLWCLIFASVLVVCTMPTVTNEESGET